MQRYTNSPLLLVYCVQNPAKAKVTRKFIVAEGLYVNYGDLAPLPQMVSAVGRQLCHACVSYGVSLGLVAMATGETEGPVPSANPVG